MGIESTVTLCTYTMTTSDAPSLTRSLRTDRRRPKPQLITWSRKHPIVREALGGSMFLLVRQVSCAILANKHGVY